VENASAAVNSLLRSFPGLTKGDKIVRFSTAYSMVIDTIDYLRETIGIEEVIVPLKYPVKGENDLLQAVEDALLQNSDIKIAIFSHISSMVVVSIL
jgi:selenocysteine lyase/cysteine desulfurase